MPFGARLALSGPRVRSEPTALVGAADPASALQWTDRTVPAARLERFVGAVGGLAGAVVVVPLERLTSLIGGRATIMMPLISVRSAVASTPGCERDLVRSAARLAVLVNGRSTGAATAVWQAAAGQVARSYGGWCRFGGYDWRRWPEWLSRYAGCWWKSPPLARSGFDTDFVIRETVPNAPRRYGCAGFLAVLALIEYLGRAVRAVSARGRRHDRGRSDDNHGFDGFDGFGRFDLGRSGDGR